MEMEIEIDTEHNRDEAGAPRRRGGIDLLSGNELHKQAHAHHRTSQRRIPDAVVCKVRNDPELRWRSNSDEGRPVTVCQRGAVRVIVGDAGESIVTVMWVHSRTGGADPSSTEAARLLREVLA